MQALAHSRRISKKTATDLPIDPIDSARAAGLRYVSDAKPGIRRARRGKGFRYTDPDGHVIRDAETLARIKSLVIPPAWQNVWICPIPNGHLQVTGRDARRRKQSRYHPRWREVRDETKYERMKLFANVLPVIRERVNHDLAMAGMPRSKVLATIVRLMETTFIRVGNEEYARENQSYGLTTMRNKHVEVHGAEVRFLFRGKSGVQHSIALEDKRIARIVKSCLDLPGYELFQYLDHEGNRHHIESADVNEYLREITNEHFTAKDFRTWAGTVLTCMLLQQCEPCETGGQAKKNIVQTIAEVAKRLGNTPSVCRKCYVHPAVLEHYLNGSLGAAAQQLAERVQETNDRSTHALRQEEIALLDLLERKIAPECAA
jgi:DNA topoisomerase I